MGFSEAVPGQGELSLKVAKLPTQGLLLLLALLLEVCFVRAGLNSLLCPRCLLPLSLSLSLLPLLLPLLLQCECVCGALQPVAAVQLLQLGQWHLARAQPPPRQRQRRGQARGLG